MSAARAAAEAAVRALGGAAVVLRVASPPVAGVDAEQLGLPMPEFQDVTVAPCAVRVPRVAAENGACTVLVAATALEAALGVRDAAAVLQSLQGVALVQVSGTSLLLREVEALQAGGSAYGYRLQLREAAAEVGR